ncbi:AIR synthase related protein [Clostridium sp. HV4-5-A1G]|uniref:AIR synthase related protein n=1 Tax=Clostridium sp. HV4-5-A1G TaxID=2004595 RepID=UPI00123A236C|nr:AIR synthase related protein [Clostridium sp. HV4-5-A1G]KAA8674763.1 alpha-ribazole-5-phosphate synthase [Clostridium sp. HV4-5-A1G]
MEIKKVRDLSLIKLDEIRTMVIACDSCGGIGIKKGDVFKVPPFYVGRYTARVVLLEVICSGAQVVTITNTICNEMDNTGVEIIKGIKEEIKYAGFRDVILTGSTEENFTTISTGLGVTAVGLAASEDLKVNNVKGEAVIICIGMPKVGDEVNLNGDREIINYETVYRLLQNDFVYEMVPVGSRGIAYEAEQLALCNNLKYHMKKDCGVDVKKSGGPETSVIAAVDSRGAEDILKNIQETHIVGYLF